MAVISILRPQQLQALLRPDPVAQIVRWCQRTERQFRRMSIRRVAPGSQKLFALSARSPHGGLIKKRAFYHHGRCKCGTFYE